MRAFLCILFGKEAMKNSDFNPIRYSVIEEKNPREIVMLRGSGCKWRRCRFCDYHLDFSKDENANFMLNKTQLEKVTGKYKKLEIINSGSFVDLDDNTVELIKEVCKSKKISELHFECHWMHRNELKRIREDFLKLGIDIKVKIGVETFDRLFRESYLVKGIETDNPKEIAEYFDEVCLLFGLPGQTAESMQNDIEIGLRYFERVCVNIMQKNTKPILPDPRVTAEFKEKLYPKYIDNDRVDILMVNTEFGVGGKAK